MELLVLPAFLAVLSFVPLEVKIGRLDVPHDAEAQVIPAIRTGSDGLGSGVTPLRKLGVVRNGNPLRGQGLELGRGPDVAA
jgi:hypothetical protein